MLLKIKVIYTELVYCNEQNLTCTWLIEWLMCLVTIGAILYIAKVDLLVEQNFVWLLLLFVVIGFSHRDDYLAHKRIDLVIKLLDNNAFHKR